MAETFKDEAPGEFDLVQQFWEFHTKALLARGVDLNQRLLSWVQQQKNSFSDPQSAIEFEELCRDGCVPQVLSVLLSFVRNSTRLSGFWTLMVGDAHSRKAMSKVLDEAADALENRFKELIADDSPEQRKQFEDLDRVPLSALVAELRLYVSILNFADTLKIEIETRSVEEFARFLLTDYVGRSTGRFHDRNIATLFCDMKQMEVYEEAAQRMWRERNYDRLFEHHQKIGNFFLAIGAVIARQT